MGFRNLQEKLEEKEGRKQDSTKKFLAMAFAFLNSQLRCANTHLDMKRTIHTVTHGITCMQSEWDLLPNDNLRFELNSFLCILFSKIKEKSSNNYIVTSK